MAHRSWNRWSRFLVSIIPRDVMTDWIVLLHPFWHLLFWMPSICRRHRLLRLFRRVHTVKHTNTERGRECAQQSLAALFCFCKDYHTNFAPFFYKFWVSNDDELEEKVSADSRLYTFWFHHAEEAVSVCWSLHEAAIVVCFVPGMQLWWILWVGIQ
jgi:hypothetical protein